MASEALSIQNALLSLVQGISGYAATAAIGMPPDTLPPTMPRAYLFAVGPWSYGWGGGYADLRAMGARAQWRIVLVNTLAANVADTPEAREEVVLTAMEALLSALAANPTLSGTVPELSVEVDPFLATQRNAVYLGCFATVTALYLREP